MEALVVSDSVGSGNGTADSGDVTTRRFLTIIALLGAVALVSNLLRWNSPDVLKYGCFLLIAIISSGMRISVPGARVSLPLTFLFVLLGIVELTPSETVLMGVLAGLAQGCWRGESRVPWAYSGLQASLMALGAEAGERVYSSPWMPHFGIDPPIRLAFATLALFLVTTVPMALVTARRERESFPAVWYNAHLWSFSYYLGGAAVAQVLSLADRYIGWQTVLLTGPVVYGIYFSYRLYLERLEDERRHAEEVSGLHLRTIEALALAIEAKDHTTHDHLQRVQVYAIELAKELGLNKEEREALRAAALLHDIGKLAVPEHIISKPGRLTPEEFEKMKIHPVVGAEILERVQFPYPVAPIVRCHHEKWDGTGYPAGTAGEAIPIGARILSVVDCLDALASDRQYRRALPLDEAMKVVVSESGKAYDPKVVEVLARRYVELERMAQARSSKLGKLSTDLKVFRGAAPAAGFEREAAAAVKTPQLGQPPTDFLTSIAAARQEVQALFEISQDLGTSLSLDETLSVLGVRLRKIIPHSALAIWIKRDHVLLPEYVTGEDYRLFSSLEIPMGQGLSGWVAENRKPILNANPTVEPGYLNDPSKFSTLRSAVAVPLEGANGVLGVLTLYHLEKDAFTKDHLRILLAISLKISMSIENVLRFRQAESSATTDYLTGLPNARSMFLQLDGELSRSRRTEQPLTLLVLDLDGFKQINDRFGHLEGNKVLKDVATALKTSCRDYDYVARMGGDEFVVLLPGMGPADVERRTSQLRDVVTQMAQEYMGAHPLTVSIGIAAFPHDGHDAEELLAEADRRMYTDKRARKTGQPARTLASTRAGWSANTFVQ
ncbi:MAG TPA: diguanylate cyclase [Bryobacteraceae bacterium]|nr:diguanylate cyclase [Bryobacteraceae bacterium]